VYYYLFAAAILIYLTIYDDRHSGEWLIMTFLDL